ncbi:MAG: hypothetical protein R3D86_09040 [Emcibacteraceae bacterium]
MSKKTYLIPIGLISAALISEAYAQQNQQEGKLSERNFERADYYRERAQVNAQSALDYPFVPYQTGRSESVDYVALTHQIQILAAQLQAVAAEAARLEQQKSNNTPGLELPSAGSGLEAFGPEGPTEKSVKVLLEYRLMVSGNPRLKVGPVKEEGDNIRAQIVTENGALVDEYLISKNNGVWSPVR